jgi:hypothetical protein
VFEASTESTDQRTKARVALWNESHSVGAAFDGIRVAILVRDGTASPNNIIERSDGPVALWWVEGPTFRRLRTSYENFRDAVRSGLRGDVLLARPDAGHVADAALADMDYQREIRGQISGYWFGP